MIDRKAAITTAILIAGTFLASLGALIHGYATHPETMTAFWLTIGHLLGPSWGIIFWLLMARGVRKYPNPDNLERPLKTHHGFMLVSGCAVVALIQMTFVAHDFGMPDPLHNMRNLPLALLGLIFVAIGNARGKLPSPYKGGYAEPFSWDKMNRFQGWVFVIYGFAMFVGAFTLPNRAILPSLVVSWLTAFSLLLLKRQQLKKKSAKS